MSISAGTASTNVKIQQIGSNQKIEQVGVFAQAHPASENQRKKANGTFS